MKFLINQIINIFFNIIVTMLIFIVIATLSIVGGVAKIYAVSLALLFSFMWIRYVDKQKKTTGVKKGIITYITTNSFRLQG